MVFFIIAAGIVGVISLVSLIKHAFRKGRVRPNPVLSEVDRRLTMIEEGGQKSSAPSSQTIRQKAKRKEERAQRKAEQEGVQQGEEHQNNGLEEQGQDVGQDAEHNGRRRSREGSGAEAQVHKTTVEADERRLEEAWRHARLADEQRRQAEELADKAAEERMQAVEQMLRTGQLHQEAEWARQAAERAAAEAREAQSHAEMQLREGIKPLLMPTREEYAAAKEYLKYQEGMFHFAVAGFAGTGKSSLVNALRGIKNNQRGAAPTGTSETTMETTGYPDSDSSNPFVWYDIPGAGTLSAPDWRYFVDQRLYIFDGIIVLYGDRFTETDVAILRNCTRWQIPAYIVRSKASQHIQNTFKDMADSEDEDDEEDVPSGLWEIDRFRSCKRDTKRREAWDRARGKYIKDTRADVKRNLALADLQEQHVYIVDKDVLVKVVKGKEPRESVDECEFYRDLLAEAARRRISEEPVECPTP